MQDNLDPDIFGQTPWQTVGPFFHYSLPWLGGADLTGQSGLGARPELFPQEHNLLNRSIPRGTVAAQAIEVAGYVRDGDGRPIPDAMLEIWQANAAGRYVGPGDARSDMALDQNFTGFGRAATSDEGLYRFRTIRPGPVPGPHNTMQAPHIAVGVFGRGLLKRLVTRLYFSDATENAADPILMLVPADRRKTLVAKKIGALWQFDIILQGQDETVFFSF
jgi:protocatechuate 3,4-dioxygenase alpha subunit